MERKAFKEAFDMKLQEFFDKKIQEIEQDFYDETLKEIITYITSFAQGGKRIRPYNVFLRYHACGGKDTEKAWQLSLTSELIHLFALIHDDIADEGTIRHDIPTYHEHLSHRYKSKSVGISQAMLMGDLVFTRALENFYQRQHSSDVNEQIRKLLNEVIFGEIIDVHLSHSPLIKKQSLIQRKDKLKSGNYTFTRPMLIGATLAGKKDTNKIEKLGENIGVAFQMRDDLMDISDPKPNKTPFSDHQEGNQTFTLLHALEHAGVKDRDYLVATRGKTLTQEEIQKLMSIFENTGTIVFAKNEVNKRLDECINQLHVQFPAGNERVDNIKKVIRFLYV